MTRWEPLVGEASKRIHVPQEWICAVIRMESGSGCTLMVENSSITSDMGAMGICARSSVATMPICGCNTAGRDPYDPRDNVIAGTAYLKWLYGKYGNWECSRPTMTGRNLDAFLTQGRDFRMNAQLRQRHFENAGPAGQSIRFSLATAKFTRPDGTPIEIDTRSSGSRRLSGRICAGCAVGSQYGKNKARRAGGCRGGDRHPARPRRQDLTAKRSEPMSASDPKRTFATSVLFKAVGVGSRTPMKAPIANISASGPVSVFFPPWLSIRASRRTGTSLAGQWDRRLLRMRPAQRNASR